MKKNGLVDDVIPEPINGAHRDHDAIFETVKKHISKYLKELNKIDPEKRVNNRIEKFSKMGVWK